MGGFLKPTKKHQICIILESKTSLTSQNLSDKCLSPMEKPKKWTNWRLEMPWRRPLLFEASRFASAGEQQPQDLTKSEQT